MQGIGLDEPLHTWFDRKVPRTTVSADYILNIIKEDELPEFNANAKVVFLGTMMGTELIQK